MGQYRIIYNGKEHGKKKGKIQKKQKGTTQSVEAVNSRKNQQPDEPIRLKTVEGFWSLMDRKYYKALGIATIEFAIAAVKSIDREYKGILQEMKRKPNTHVR